MRITILFICVLGLMMDVSGFANAQNTVATHSTPIAQAESFDQTTPWNLEQLRQPPEFEWAQGSEVRSLYYNSEAFRGHQTRVFAYYATPGTLAGDPAKDKNLPAIVLVHGGGGTAYPEWVRLWASRGYAAIAMDLAGCGPNGERLPEGGPSQDDAAKFGSITEPITNQWTYHAVASVVRAHSLLRSFPEVDRKRTAITGISWGGFLTCIVAGIDHRFKAAVPVYGCGFLHENSAWLGFAKLSPDNQLKWTQLWDPAMYVGATTVPMLFVNGGKDLAYLPHSHAKTYALVKSPKNMHFVPKLEHGHYFDRPDAIEVFIQHHLAGGPPLAKITSLKIEDDQVSASVETETRLVKAELHYTLGDMATNPQNRIWITQPATVENNIILADTPPEHATIWFLTLEDDRGTTVSSKLMFPAD